MIGAGHNGLAAACYLAKAGYRVLVLERRNIIGGAVVTETDIFPGYRVDTCSSFHVVIHGTPVVQELELEKFGLEYIDVDPWAFAPFPNGNYIVFYRDLERTADSIARFSPRDGETYYRLMKRWISFNRTMLEVFCTPPSPGRVAAKVLRHELANGLQFFKIGVQPGTLRSIFSPYGKVIRENFHSPEVRAALGWLGAQSGPGPDDPISGELLLMQQSLYHLLGVKRPSGGSGMLTQAMGRCLEYYGGEIRTEAEVKQIMLKDGAAAGVELSGGERFYAPLVISNAHVKTTLLKMLPGGTLPHRLDRRVRNIKVADLFGMTVRYATKALPNYSALPTRDPDGNVQPDLPHRGMQLLCPSLEYLERTYEDARQGLPPTNPAVIAMTPGAIDPTLVPEGGQLMYIWAQSHPYRLSNGENWPEIRQREADKCLQVVEDFAPGIREQVLGQYIKTPPDLEEINGLVKGNLMHIDMSIGQMFFWRPLPELARYRTPIPGLYLTGAGTHPGGGVSGAPGYNTANTVLSDLKGRKR